MNAFTKVISLAAVFLTPGLSKPASVAPANTSPDLRLTFERGAHALSWPSPAPDFNGGNVRLFFELQRSVDLRHWEPLGQRLCAPADDQEQIMRVRLEMQDPAGFFRLLQVAPNPVVATLGFGGAKVLGYGDAFQ